MPTRSVGMIGQAGLTYFQNPRRQWFVHICILLIPSSVWNRAKPVPATLPSYGSTNEIWHPKTVAEEIDCR